MGKIIFDPKRVGETKTLRFDFKSSLYSDETLSSGSVCSASVYSGTDANPNNILLGATSSSGSVVSQKVTAGVTGVIYDISCACPTSTTQTLIQAGRLAVLPNI